MSFFGGISNVQFPQVVMNSGPLPPAGGLPAPLHDTADARINYGSTLLGNLDPYAYGEGGYLSTQQSYVNKPHRMHKLVSQLQLPRGQVNSSTTFQVSHPVDDSDIAFTMRLDRGSYICAAMGQKSLSKQRIGTTVDPLINLPTLNYLLAGLQLCYQPGQPQSSKWADLLHHLDKDRFYDHNVELGLKDLRYIVRELIKPFGVTRGSEKQGGQDEVGLSPATWPVNFVSNFVLDGHEANMVNIWHYHEVSAGDDLVLRLKPMPIPRGSDCYTLNHYYKCVARQDFESYFQSTQMHMLCTHVWQLVPDVFSLDYAPENGGIPGGVHEIVMPTRFPVPQDYVWQEMGYWHIGRSQVQFRKFVLVQFRKYATGEYYHNDMANQLKVNHLDMTFQPSWHKAPGEQQNTPRAITGPAYAGPAAARIAPGMRAVARSPWEPALRLETPFAPPPQPLQAPDGFMFAPLAARNDAFAAPAARPRPLAAAAVPAPAPLAPVAEAPEPPEEPPADDEAATAAQERRKTQLAAGFADLFRQRSEARSSVLEPPAVAIDPQPAPPAEPKQAKQRKRVTHAEPE